MSASRELAGALAYLTRWSDETTDGGAVIDYPFYRPTAAELAAFIASQRMGRLVTANAEGCPHIGLYPFVTDGEAVEVHLVKGDGQVADIRQNPRVVFEVDEILAFMPSYLEHPESGQKADHHYRTAMIEGEARIADEPDVVAEHLSRLIARYQPEGGYRPVTAPDPMYAPGVGRLVMIRVEPTRVWAKFKLGQQPR
jgi:nitroimidazol reductase NimA-like FMN-containing flavoprotein (pyridoxamine 5'-phosphate oxidase superfamily)